jgi:hypothetical protein
LESHLREQHQFLVRSSAAFDQGFEAEAKRLATVIRVLLHDTSSSTSLLSQLHVKKTLKYVDTALPFNPNNLLPTGGLTVMRLQSPQASGDYVAPLDELAPPRQKRPKEFDAWWNDPILKDAQGSIFSRKKLVLEVANSDGGAHVDPALNAAYEALARHNSFGWVISTSAGPQPFTNSPILPSIRQIAYEVERTITTNLGRMLSDNGKR